MYSNLSFHYPNWRELLQAQVLRIVPSSRPDLAAFVHPAFRDEPLPRDRRPRPGSVPAGLLTREVMRELGSRKDEIDEFEKTGLFS